MRRVLINRTKNIRFNPRRFPHRIHAFITCSGFRSRTFGHGDRLYRENCPSNFDLSELPRFFSSNMSPKIGGILFETRSSRHYLPLSGYCTGHCFFSCCRNSARHPVTKALVFSIVFYSIGSMLNLLMHLVNNSEGTLSMLD